MNDARTFDYIIVGAGSAGCTLAYRLSEDPESRVLVLEAGGWDRDPLISVPWGWGKILFERLHDWGYFTEPEPNMNGRKIECARGKVIGGSSSINAMAYVRGHAGDYDRWRQTGLTGWSYADALPYFRRAESWEGGENDYRGGDGPLTTHPTQYQDPLIEAWLEAARAAGHEVTDDYNGEQNEGFCLMQSTIRDGRRCSAAAAYLRPAIKRPNVTVETAAFVDRVVLQNGRAVGVAYTRNGAEQKVQAEREVILSGGVINSPQLLMLSGIGEPDQLAEFGIETQIELSGVGKNLQDHLSVGVEYWRKGKGPFVGYLRYDRLALAMAQAYLFGKGPATEMSGPVMAFIKTRPELAVPNLQFLMRFIPPESHPWFPGIRKEPRDAFMCRPVLLHPESRGEIRLRSSNPRDKVKIHQNFLAAENDRKTLRDGLRLVREIATQKPLDPFRGEEIAPGPAVQSDDELDAYVRETGWTAHHPLGSCKMGADGDAMAVVDPELRVRGVEGLRVVDASVIPDMVGGNINAPVIMIAEKASDHIRGRAPLEPAEV